MKFVWRLQRVLDLKEQMEKVQEAELLHLTEALTAAKVMYLHNQRQLRQKMTAIAQAHPQSRMPRQQFFMKYAAYDDERLRQEQEAITRLEIMQRERIATLTQLKREREGMEKLREEAKRRFELEQEKRQQKERDDLTHAAFAHKRKGTA